MSTPPDKTKVDPKALPYFNRDVFDAGQQISRIGQGHLGGKGNGLAFIQQTIDQASALRSYRGFEVSIPRTVVITTDVFDRFMQLNDLYDIALSGARDQEIALSFQEADLPPETVGDIRALSNAAKQPLAVRSSSLLEDAIYEPFAGVYATKMIPNNQPEPDQRFRRLVEAIKFVYASTYFSEARDYLRRTGRADRDEKMALVVQEVVGHRFQDRFYPHISGVARSYNFYPTGSATPEQGVITLALGLGKTIVDGGVVWSYSPALPLANPPVSSARDLLKLTQTTFWSVGMGKPPAHDPTRETEYLVQGDLSAAEFDGSLKFIASTYRAADDRIVTGTGSDGPRVINFAPILRLDEIPLNKLIVDITRICEESLGSDVEIEFAVVLDSKQGLPARLGFLQVRPMVVTDASVEVSDEDFENDDLMIASRRAIGNGLAEDIEDIVYVVPEAFDPSHSREIAAELADLNRELLEQNRPYILIGFGRWGSSDPWLGIPVNWSQISGAKVIVEATLEKMDVELSQGSHFFHNITSFQLFYLSVHHSARPGIDWSWLAGQAAEKETRHLRHIHLDGPVTVKVDGRGSRGVVLHGRE